jgi:hypothetical protein
MAGACAASWLWMPGACWLLPAGSCMRGGGEQHPQGWHQVVKNVVRMAWTWCVVSSPSAVFEGSCLPCAASRSPAPPLRMP